MLNLDFNLPCLC